MSIIDWLYRKAAQAAAEQHGYVPPRRPRRNKKRRKS